ncbi:lytic transglycosylase domain-containing protein [Lichenicoccus sp.]|uniref:lytic transglycosylase domain-containing protein n=1 Tax=Lichenicoccus sp. TaxID=2781899 RepID=UPI003D0A49E1
MTRQTGRRGQIRTATRPVARPPTRQPALLRAVASILLLTLLAACAGTPRGPMIPVAQEAADYRAHARNYYAPPGPPDDPWGPYIEAASNRFDVPDAWIRAVIHQESGGHEFINGQFVTSVPGAMGLMQLMPPTYDDMRNQYALGPDPYDPHDNVMAGTAYLRQMYDIYGSPGFLAAYNTGPGRLDDFLTRNRALPNETRQYVAIIGPQIAGVFPSSRSQADLMVMNHAGAANIMLASAQTQGETRSVRMAWARRRDHSAGDDQPVQVAEAPATAPTAAPAYQAAWNRVPPAAPAPSAPVQVAAAASSAGVSSVWASRLAANPAPPVRPEPAPQPAPAPTLVARVEPPRRRFHLVAPAMAMSIPTARTAGGVRDWAIQVGAFGTEGQASEAAGTARSRMRELLPGAQTEIAGIRAGRGGARIYRARLTGLSRNGAMAACERLSRGRGECMVVSPDGRL